MNVADLNEIKSGAQFSSMRTMFLLQRDLTIKNLV